MSELTKHKKGSIKEAFIIAFPLMISGFSMSMLTLSDRILVTRLGLNYLQGMNNASSAAFTFAFALCGITGIASVFVGRFNGEGKYHKISMPVWQMIYFSFFCALITIPIGLFTSSYVLVSEAIETGEGYFKWAVSTAFMMPLIYAVSAFFIGTGDTKAITISMLSANVVNVILNFILIFGFPGCFVEFGIYSFGTDNIVMPLYGEGAAIATFIAQIIQFIILIKFMFKVENNKKYKTHNYSFNKKLFYNCIRIGWPSSFTRFAEMLGWYILSAVFTHYSIFHLHILAISISMFIAFSFLNNSLRDSIASIVSNHIGSKNFDCIHSSVKSILSLEVIILIICFIPMLFYKDASLSFLMGGNEDVKNNMIFYNALKFSFPFMMFAIFLSVTNTIFVGLFMAGGDTKFIMLTNPTISWCLVILPSIFAISKYDIPLKVTMFMFLPYRIFMLAIMYWRYCSGKWIKKLDNKKS